MDFLKKHYEKLILLVMLVAFIIMMIHVLTIAKQTTVISDDQLKIPTRQADYIAKKPTDPIFDTAKTIYDTRFDWPVSEQREKLSPTDNNPELFSDLVATFKMARCPHCGRIIPRWCFENRKCLDPLCGKKLVKPPAQPRERLRMITENDSDGDGMPNDYERSMGFDPNNAADALYDRDGDGFSNLFEFENNTDPRRSRSRLPLWYRLRYLDVKQVELPVRLMAINTMESKDPKNWNLQLNFFEKKRVRGRWVDRTITKNKQIGFDDLIQLDDRTYKIVKAEASIVKDGLRTKTIGRIWLNETDVRKIDGREAKIDKLVLDVGKPVYSNDKRLIVEDIGDPLTRVQYFCKPGVAIRIGRRREGIESYVLTKLDIAKKQAFFSLHNSNSPDPSKDKKGRKIIVTTESAIPQEYWVQQQRESEKRLSKDIDQGGYRSRRR